MVEPNQYYTYYDQYRIQISSGVAEENIKKIFSQYSKELVIKFINSLVVDIDSDVFYNSATLQKLQKKYLNLDSGPNIIHRRAIHVLSQIFYSFDKYNNLDSSICLSGIDTFRLFLLANTILDKAEGQDFSSPLKVFFNCHKFSVDLMNKFDLQNIFYFYIQFYKRIKHTRYYDSFNEAVVNETKISIADLANQLEVMFLQKGFLDINLLKHCFGIESYKTYEYWNCRKPQTPIPFEYRILEEKPIIKFQETHYALLSKYFIYLALAKKIYFILRGIDAQKWGKEFGIIVEDIITEYLRNALINDNCVELNLKYNNGEYADFGIVMDNIVFLFEIKTSLLSLDEKYEQCLKKFQEKFDKKFVNKEGVTQQLRRLKDIDSNYKQFCKVTKLDESNNYLIIPILIFLNEEFFCPGFNKYIRSRFNERKIELGIEMKNINCSQSNSSIILNELKSSIDYFKKPEKVLNSLYRYNHLSTGSDPYEYYLDSNRAESKE